MTHLTRAPRIFYFAPVAIGDDAVGFETPAVRNKVLGVCSAMTAAGLFCILVSPLASRRAVSLFRPVGLARMKRLVAVPVFSRGRAGLHRAVQLFTLAIAGLKLVRRGDRVILYNFFPEYLLLALLLRLRGIMCVVDIEDAPRADEPGTRGIMNRWSYALLIGIAATRQIIVSDKLARELGLTRYLPLYGVSTHFRASATRPALFTGPAVRINLGGAVLRETGGALFAEALRILAREYSDRPLHFFVTGHIEPGLLDGLADAVNATAALRLEIAADLDFDAYRALLDTMDVGLCLKLVSSSMGQTTFPSKVIEIAALGLLLITMPVSDVPLIFDNNCAIVLDSEDPEDLARVFASLPEHRAELASRAYAGQARVDERFSAAGVGATIRRFLDVK